MAALFICTVDSPAPIRQKHLVMRLYIHIFVLAAFILSGISPACAFVSGKSSFVDIEICTNDGLKTIKVAADEAPEESNHDDHDKNHDKKNDCGFCFAQTHLKSAKADGTALSFAQLFSETRAVPKPSASSPRFELSSLSARAPPLS